MGFNNSSNVFWEKKAARLRAAVQDEIKHVVCLLLPPRRVISPFAGLKSSEVDKRLTVFFFGKCNLMC
jgi:hypothetical protein